MNGQRVEFIADTSAVIQLLRGDEKVASQIRGKNFAITFVTMAELSVGVLKSLKPNSAFARIKEVLRGQKIIPISPATPNIYARIYVDLEKNGALIPVNDIWIAALAIERQLPIFARDEHFSRIKNLTVINC
jgi:tRNA(fMet)-specific endonuclease VapC